MPNFQPKDNRNRRKARSLIGRAQRALDQKNSQLIQQQFQQQLQFACAAGWVQQAQAQAAMGHTLPAEAVRKPAASSNGMTTSKPQEPSEEQDASEQAPADAPGQRTKKFCPYCGGKSLPHFKFCQFCGTSVSH
jgi:hypothetical protein